jgi:hypothetical protein
MPGPKMRFGVDTKVRPADTLIAALAYVLWVNKGRSAGSDQEDWYQAEAILENLLTSNFEGDRTNPEIVVEFQGDGHWEIWEREWGGARWVCDTPQR